MNTAAEFWARVERKQQTECWPWLGAIDSGGYGSLRWQGGSARAHQIALRDTVGPPPDSDRRYALHHCDNRKCCNPDHLYWGTYRDNALDREKRGRGGGSKRRGDRNGLRKHPESVLRGEFHGSAILTEQEVRSILARGLRPCEIVREYKISPSQAKRIVRRISWKHL